MTGTIVIDPGHGGALEVGGSSANNATSASGVLEKNMTLRLGLLVRQAIADQAARGGHTIKVLMTRDKDVNRGLADRASVAKNNNADLFLAIHFNASEQHTARGVETLVSPKDRNANHAADVAFAQRIQSAVFKAIKAHDPATRDRKVKDQPLAVLNERNLGTKARGCLLEVEFIDVVSVDELLNLNVNAQQVRVDIANAIAGAMLEELAST
jgi:N-acetylmuramoyl-L-alanine amidase